MFTVAAKIVQRFDYTAGSLQAYSLEMGTALVIDQGRVSLGHCRRTVRYSVELMACATHQQPSAVSYGPGHTHKLPLCLGHSFRLTRLTSVGIGHDITERTRGDHSWKQAPDVAD